MNFVDKLLAQLGLLKVPVVPSESNYRDVTSHIESLDSIPELIENMRSYDGYARQAAIKHSVAIALPELLPAIAERLNDWVPQVRDAARSAILTLLPQMPVADVVALLPAIMKLRLASRHDHNRWLIQFEGELLRCVHVDGLLAGINSDNIKSARACFDVLQRSGVVDSASLALRAISSRRDIAMARQAASMIARLPPEARDTVYAAAMQSNFGAIRIFSVRACLREQAGETARALAINMLLDPQASVREAMIAYLISNSFDIGTYYRDILESQSTRPATVCYSLAALGNLRQASDISMVRKFCSHPLPSVRLQAYAAWLRIAPADKDLVAQEAVLDDARRVTRAALDMVVKHGAFIPFATVCAKLNAPEDRRLLLSFAERSGQRFS